MVLRAEGELSAGVTMQNLRAYQIALVSNAANVPRQVVEIDAGLSNAGGLPFFAALRRRWAADWRELTADLARFWHWQPSEAWGITGTELLWWLDQANRIIARENPE
jgi:hypothetical protein